MHWMLMPLRRYADFQGRSRRKEFWMWQLFNLIIGGILGIILAVMVVGASTRAALDTSYDGRDSGSSRSEESRGVDEDRGSSRDEESGSTEDGGKPTGDETSSRDPDATDGYLAQSYSSSYSSSSSSVQVNDAVLRELGAGFWIVVGLMGLYSLFILIPNLAVTIRRLHDLDKSGFFIFLGLIPLVGGIILLVFYFMEGTRGPNRFGPDPKGAGHGGTFR